MECLAGYLRAHIYRLNWGKRTSWDGWDDTALRTHDSKFEPWRSEGEYATSRHGGSPEYWFFYGWGVKKHFDSLKRELPERGGGWTRDFRLSKQTVLDTAPGPPANLANVHFAFKMYCLSPLKKLTLLCICIYIKSQHGIRYDFDKNTSECKPVPVDSH